MEELKTYILKRVDDYSDSQRCWNWTASIGNSGYGVASGRFVNQKKISAHRLSFIAFRQPVKKGLDVCHTCDNRRCVNPNHLWIGTHKENVKDSIEKGKFVLGRSGQDHIGAVLTEQNVIDIYKRAHAGENQRRLAREYGVSNQCVTDIKLRRRWKKFLHENFPEAA